MKRILAILMLAFASVGRGAVGDLIGLEVETNGWILRATIDGIGITNGNFYGGFATNNTLTGTNKLTLTVTGPGFDSTGTSQQVSRVVYGTKILRAVYPMQNTNDIVLEGSNVKVKIILSQWIHAGETITASSREGWFAVTNSGGAITTNANAFTSATVTNSSTQTYQPPIINWTAPGLSRETGSVIRLRAVGFHGLAIADFETNQPLAAMVFIIRQETGEALTNIQSGMVVDRSIPDFLRFGEYIADFDPADLTDGTRFRQDIIGYPRYGTNIFNTCLDRFPPNSPRPSGWTNFVDTARTYSRVINVVDGAAGSDANGRSATNTTPDTIDSSLYFLTVAGALNNAAASNNTFYGHNDAGGAIIYIRSATTNFLGGTLTATTVPDVPPILTPYPGDSVTLTARGSSGTNLRRIILDGISTAWISGQVPMSVWGFVWFRNCPSFTSVSTGPMANVTNAWVTHSQIGSFAQGLRGSSSATSFSLRGNSMNGYSQASTFRTWVGNWHGDTNQGPAYTILAGAASDSSDDEFKILYNNAFLGHHSTANFLGLDSNSKEGIAVVQNVFEKCLGGQPGAAIWSEATAGMTYTNLIFWHNLIEGGRIADFLSDSGSIDIPRIGVSAAGNIWSYPGQKSEVDTPASSNRLGSWTGINMVGGRGNFYIRNSVTGSVLDFRPEFAGLDTYEPGYTNVNNFVLFVDRQAGYGAVGTLGGGNYRLQNASPALGVKGGWTLPFDIDGFARSANDPPGPTASGNAKKGAFF